MMEQYRLTAELVPRSLWGVNLRKLLPVSEWDRIRKEAYARQNQQCAICGHEGRLECHERWEYDDAARVQRLTGFMAVCPPCHQVKHLGMTGIRASRGEIDYEQVTRHFIETNACDRDACLTYLDEVKAQWEERSKQDVFDQPRDCVGKDTTKRVHSSLHSTSPRRHGRMVRNTST